MTLYVGSIHTPNGRIFQINPRADGLHEIHEMDTALMPGCAQDEITHGPGITAKEPPIQENIRNAPGFPYKNYTQK